MNSDEPGRRRARVNRDGDGQPVGCAVFLSARQLRDLGVEPETVDNIEYTVEGGEIHLMPPDCEVIPE